VTTEGTTVLDSTTTPAAPTGPRHFPTGFQWGAATAAFQIEGSTSADGRTDSIWDAFARRPGAILGGHTGEPGADHYRRMPEDVALMAEIGLTTYRFSVAWPRVRPDGGGVEQRGLDFYRRLVDELLAHGITPWVTLYHWDLPQALEDRGGWTSRDTAHRFAEFADTVHGALGDRVHFWTTLNEPWCSALLGYASGEHAPGRVEPRAAVAAAHHLLLSHGLAGAAIRARDPRGALGITLNLSPVDAVDPDDPIDAEAVRRIDGLQNRLFLEPVVRGAYPADVAADLEPFGLADHVREGDLALISAPIDLLGVNYYVGTVVSGHPDPAAGPPPSQTSAGLPRPRAPGSPWIGAADVSFHSRGRPVTGQDWEVYPEGLTRTLTWLSAQVPGLPLYVTENGAAYPDEVRDGAVHDPDRLAYVAAHVSAVHDAIEAGADVRGYFAWSLLDNFEWAWGYACRFGIVFVDYETQQRIPKSSARWYASVISANAVP
jgi:beta-glucosidase